MTAGASAPPSAPKAGDGGLPPGGAGHGGRLEEPAVVDEARVARPLQLVEQPPFELRARARMGRVGGEVPHLIRVGFQVVQLLAGPLAVGPPEIRLPAGV